MSSATHFGRDTHLPCQHAHRKRHTRLSNARHSVGRSVGRWAATLRCSYVRRYVGLHVTAWHFHKQNGEFLMARPPAHACVPPSGTPPSRLVPVLSCLGWDCHVVRFLAVSHRLQGVCWSADGQRAAHNDRQAASMTSDAKGRCVFSTINNTFRLSSLDSIPTSVLRDVTSTVARCNVGVALRLPHLTLVCLVLPQRSLF